jgi:hypothetical protein
MRRRPRGLCALGAVSIVLGTVILLAMLLPSGFWWFVLGAGLIVTGICLLRSF